MRVRLYLTISAVAASTCAHAVEPIDRPIGYYGFPGNDSCANWTENRGDRGHRTQALEGWVLGYLTAYNAYADETGSVETSVNATAVLGWVDNYCRANPLDTLMTATLKLIRELEARSN